jgi:hypothetical protein
MLNVVSGNDGPAFSVNASLTGLAIYLDNYAIMDLAEGDISRRQRFISALHSGAELLFSVSNLVDLTGPLGASRDAAQIFLDEVGGHWFPVEIDPVRVIEQERNGIGPAMNCLSERFLRDFLVHRLRNNSGAIIDLSPDSFFRLGAVLEWIGPQRDSIREGLVDLDEALVNRIEGYRVSFENDPNWLDQAFPVLQFNPSKPATFAYGNLVRTLIVEAVKGQKIKKGDGLDFFHAVIACGCASAAMLDKHWKRRVEAFPQPNRIAPIYYGPDLDQLVSDLYARTVQNAPALSRG